MTMPRQILPGSTYLITRRCTQGETWLKPSAMVNEIFLYCLAVAAERFDVSIHCVCVMANHYHVVVTDNAGRVPEFMAYVHKYVAKCINAAHGRTENLWAGHCQPSLVRLVSMDDILSKMLYAMNNPVAAGLVAKGGDWPGLRTRPADLLSKANRISRPEHYFSGKGRMPVAAELIYTIPCQFSGSPPESFVALLESNLSELEEDKRKSRLEEDRGVLGTARIVAQPPGAKVKSRLPSGELNPTVAARDGSSRREALGQRREFLNAYLAAHQRWKEGERDVLFPLGTYALRRYAAVAIET